MAWKEISAICLVSIVIMLALPTVSASNASLSDLRSAISSFDDPHMDAKDLAFYLATHDFDARPNDNYVKIDLSKIICTLTPNGPAPKLCTISTC
jgi:hypothetical protein